jgi:hypothetical protein
VKTFVKFGRNVSWIEKKYGKYGIKVSWIVKKYRKIWKRWKLNSEKILKI